MSESIALGKATGRRVFPEQLPGVIVQELRVFADQRGSFRETFRKAWLPERDWVQGNRSDSHTGALRGLHFHRNQSDYWCVLRGRAFAALADLRRGSPTEGAVAGLVLDGRQGLCIPPGVAHGYLALEPTTLTYMVDAYYDPDDEHGVRWDDPDLNIPWPRSGGPPILSSRDRENPSLRELDLGLLQGLCA